MNRYKSLKPGTSKYDLWYGMIPSDQFADLAPKGGCVVLFEGTSPAALKGNNMGNHEGSLPGFDTYAYGLSQEGDPRNQANTKPLILAHPSAISKLANVREAT